MSLRTSYQPDRVAEAADWFSARTRAARDAGLDGLFVGDHHCTGPSSAYFQNTPLLGRLLADWDDRPVGSLFLIPLWHPVLLAEQVGTLAVLTSGPFVLQAAIGDGRPPQFPGMGVTPKGRIQRFEVALSIIRRLLAGEHVTDETGTFPIVDACIAPVPSSRVDCWIGATALAGIDRAARLGDGWECNAHVNLEEAEAQARAYLDACQRYGRDPGVVAIRRDVHVADDSREAASVADRVLAAGYRGCRAAALTFGDATQVTAQLRRYGDMGYTDIIVRHFSDDQASVLSSLTLLGDVRRSLA
jgi:alkanesulfonate monooxygenase SsuD/methylene tetrahydromethanopterin reductase-like flavin-dependent oxidoreductase (luciferase family)